jgi:hypothetical protein
MAVQIKKINEFIPVLFRRQKRREFETATIKKNSKYSQIVQC